ADPGTPAGGANAAGGAVSLSAADCAVLCGRIESPLPASGLLVPLVLRDRIVAVLYADQLPQTPDAAPGGGSLSLPALQSLVYVAALAIESLPFRHRAATATLQTEGDAAAAAASAAAAVEPAAMPAGDARHKGDEAAAAPTAAEPAAAPAAFSAPTAAAAPLAAGEQTGAAAFPAASPALAPVAPPTPVAPTAPDAAAELAALGGLAATLGTAGETSPAPAPAAAAAAAPAPGSPGSEDAAAGPAASVPPAPPAPSPGSGEASRPTLPASAASPFVSPVDLYDSPNVPLVKETAEIPVSRPLRPVAAAGAETTTVARGGESPYLADSAAAGTAAAASENETVLLPHAALREAGTSPWGKKAAEAAKGPGGPGLAVLPPLPDSGTGPDSGTAAVSETAPEASESPASPLQAPTRIAGTGGAATLRAVPSAPPFPSAQPPAASGAAGAASSGAGTQAAGLSSVSPLSPTSPAAFEPLRTGPIGSGTPEVRPPTGVQGPGWAFATTRIQASSSEEALHEEARRLARLLVSEIKLYNEEQVELGRRNRDIYERLREDIDRSRQMYEERVEPRIAKATDYFYQELVRILAAGDSKALGI
ncbi:MAG TPA: hypothetical protein VMW75_26540, partial [Thermoanaerobaculia bacterium]|nr:hypothetical protein [Thermoanaerobaculia bacterium]